MTGGPRPQPTPLQYITPTSLAELETCAWRAGFHRDPSTSYLSRSTPASALGSVAHAVVKMIGDPRGFDAVWAEAVASAEETLASDWSPATPPSAEHWPGWALTKVRIRKVWQQAKTGSTTDFAGGHIKTSAFGELNPPLPWRGRWLAHPVLQLAGRPDLVRRVDGALWVIDLKTGLHQGEPTAVQKAQLLLYCALVEANLGEMPARAAVETTRADHHSFRVEGSAVREVVGAASAALAGFNAAAAKGLGDDLAQPSVTNCAWCSFRVACRPFFERYDPSWAIADALVIMVDSIYVEKDRSHMKAVVQQPEWRCGERVDLIGFPFRTTPAPGQVWATADFVGQGSSSVASWNTTTHRWT